MRVQFSDEEKIKYFDEIVELFYQKNFGQTSKTDFELLMFSFYLDTLIKSNQREDGTVNYVACSDYRISQDLGITAQKVRNLKVKKQLIYPIEYSWQKALAGLTKFARYDRSTGLIALNIPDPNLYLAIENHIEEQGGYVEIQLNRKLLKTRVEYYVELLASGEGKEAEEVIKRIKKEIKSDEKKYSIDNVSLGKMLEDSGIAITTILSNVVSMAPIGNYIIEAFKFLI